jgi:hypothetical protein
MVLKGAFVMWRLGIAASAVAAIVLAEGFTFNIASPVAAQDFHAKMAAFVFRTQGCAEPAKAEISGRAEGIVKGERRSVALKIVPMGKPGVYAVNHEWPAEGDWLVNLKGTCGDANAGAIVPVGAKGFIRESSKFFPRPATDAEVDAALKAHTPGGGK